MHFRVRKNVIQLIRTTFFDESRRKGNNAIFGTVKLGKLELSNELRDARTTEEIAAFENWLKTQRRSDALREELAALTTAETMLQAEKSFDWEGDPVAACTAARDIFYHWQSFRHLFTKNGLLD